MSKLSGDIEAHDTSPFMSIGEVAMSLLGELEGRSRSAADEAPLQHTAERSTCPPHSKKKARRKSRAGSAPMSRSAQGGNVVSLAAWKLTKEAARRSRPPVNGGTEVKSAGAKPLSSPASYEACRKNVRRVVALMGEGV